ncbi:MAG: hypothetical protein J7M40_19710 [Planctomycetes bacterium]|nr:hypothetical protein [Planctomycetota bacterium]
MKTVKAAWIRVIILALCVSVGWTQEPPGELKAQSQKKAVPPTRQASCIVKITADPAVFPLTIDNVMYLAHSSGVGGRAIGEILGYEAPAPDELIGVEELAGPDSDRSEGYGDYGMGVKKTYGFSYYGGEGSGGYSMTGPEAENTPPAKPAATPGARTGVTTRTTRRPTPAATPATSSMRSSAPTATGSSSRYRATSRSSKAPVSRTPSTTSTRSTRPTTSRSYGYTRTTPARASAAASAPRDQDQVLFFQLNVNFRDYKDVSADAQAVMLTVVKYLREALESAFRDQGHSLGPQIELADQEVSRAEAELVALQSHLRDISGSQDLSRQVILSDVRGLRNELESTKMQQAADEAMMEALINQIEQSRRKLAEKLQTDDIMQELEQIVKINKKKMEYTNKLHEKGTASQLDMAKATEELARARIEFAKRAEEVSLSVAGGQEGEWNDKLASISVEMAQNAARVAGLQPQLKRGEVLLAMADRYEVESLKSGLAKRNLEKAILWQSQMSRKVRVLSPPTVIVIGAE